MAIVGQEKSVCVCVCVCVWCVCVCVCVWFCCILMYVLASCTVYNPDQFSSHLQTGKTNIEHRDYTYKTAQTVRTSTKLTTSMYSNYNSWHSSQSCIDCILSSTVTITYVYILMYWFHWLDIHGSVHHGIITKKTNKMQLCRIIYCSLTTLHVPSDIFAHYQENLNCIYSFTYVAAGRSRQRHTWIIPEAVNTVKMLLIMSENIAQNM